MADVWHEVRLDLDELARDIAGMAGDEPIEFLLAVDAEVAETSFTRELIDRLQESLKESNGG